MTYDASDRKSIRKAEKAVALADRNRISFLQSAMAQPLGRAWLHELLTRCHLFHSPFVKGAPDATAFNCGAQNVGLQTFIDIVVHCPSNYVLMMQEAAIKEASDARSEPDTDTDSAGPTRPAEEPGRDDFGSIDDPANFIDADGFVTWPGRKSVQ